VIISSFACTIVNANECKSLSEAKTEWTLGLGAGVFDYNLYPGEKATNRLIIPAPYFTFCSPWLEIDRGIKGFLYDSEFIILDISADFGLPVDSDDSPAREGMPDLDLMVQFGPSLEFLLNDKNKNYFDARFEIPVRVAFVTDINSAENIGYLFEPRFSFNHRRQARTGLSHKATLGVKFSTEDYHSYYYDVAAEFSTATRPEYKSDAGYGGSFIDYSINYKTKKFVYWTLLRYQSLHGAVFEDSPLVLTDDYYFIGFGFAWIIAGSL
jgi:outer membrane scaffolding protein for murein synthesis (MipA/OmpV family)